MPLATVKALGAGWATAPVVLPQGASRGPLRIAGFDTQCDVKCRHADGSIKFAVLTARVPAAGDYAVAEGGTVLPVIPLPPAPNVKVWVSNDTTSWGASLRDLPLSGDRWLDGLLAVEERHVAPFTLNAVPGGEEFPGLRAYFDVRYYRDGGVRVSLCVENCLEGAAPRQYHLTIHQDGEYVVESLFPPTHNPHSRYRLTFPLNGLQEAFVLPDWSTAVAAGAVPRYSSTAAGAPPAVAPFRPLEIGNLTAYMPAGGGREEIGPYPAWTARGLGGNANALALTLAYGENPSGAWPWHVRGPDGSIPTITDRPLWLLRPPAGPLTPDVSHHPSLAYIPYLATGDRYYAEEMAFSANYCVATQPTTWRRGSQGILEPEQTRGIAWGLRQLVDAAAYLPDGDPIKGYFAGLVRNNLAWMDTWARDGKGAWGVAWHGAFEENGRRVVRPWMYDYLAWSIHHAHKQGFGGGDAWLKQILDFRLGWLSDPNYRQWAGAYTLPVDGGNAPGDYSGVWQDPPDWPKAHYWPDVMLSVTAAEERGDARAAAARRWIEANTSPQPSFADRPHFSVLPRPLPVPEPPEPPPPDPVVEFPVESFGVKLGLTARWDALGGRYRVGLGERLDLRVDESSPGYDPAVAAATFGPPGVEHDYGNTYPLPSAIVPTKAGPHELRFSTASGQLAVVPVEVVEGRYVDVGPLKTLGSSYTFRDTSDDAIGVLEYDGVRRWHIYSTDAHGGEVTTWLGTADNHRESGGWHATIQGAPGIPTNICNGGQAVDVGEAWLMVTLNQVLLPTGGPHAGYGYEGIAVSTDQGRSWKWVGPCSSYPVTYEQFLADPDSYGTFICGGGSLHHLSDSEGEWLYCYPSCVLGPCQGEKGKARNFVGVSMVRAPARELVALALQGQDCRHLWRGWYQGGWNSLYNGPRDPIMPYGGYGGAKVAWCDPLNRWIAVFHGPETWGGLFLSTAEARTGPWSWPQRLWSAADIPAPWPVTLWGAPMLLEPGGTVGSTFHVGIVAYDGRDPLLGGTGEVRVVGGRVAVR